MLAGAAIAALILPLATTTGALAAPAADAGTTTLTSAGAFTQAVPDGVCSVNVVVAGAPGGVAIANGDVEPDPDNPGELRGINGAGATISAHLDVHAGQYLTGTVGARGADGGTGGAPGGGNGGTGGHRGGGGGGYSELSFGGDRLLLAAGGGGTGGGHTADHGHGGDGGADLADGISISGGTVIPGGDGTAGQDSGVTATPATAPGGGKGGSTVGGAAGTNPRSGAWNWDASPGGSLQGGNGGADNSFDSGAGGGSGFFGGGGGASTDGDVGNGTTGYFVGGGGGGGSSYVADSTLTSGIDLAKNRDDAGTALNAYVRFDWVMCAYDLEVTKSVVGTPVFEDGDTIRYSVTVKNNGDDDMAIGDTVTLIDSLATGGTLVSVDGLSGSTPAVGGSITAAGIEAYDLVSVPGPNPGDDPVQHKRGLAAGDSVTVVYDTTVTGSEPVTNTVTVSDRGNQQNNTASAAVDPAAPALTLEKSASTDKITKAGQKITYSFKVTNTGNIRLTDIAIAEGTFSGTGTLSTPVCPADPEWLQPGDAVTCTAQYVATQADVDAGSIENDATASGTTPGGTAAVSALSKAKVTVDQQPSLRLVKKASTDRVSRAGQTIHYTFTLTNTGNVTLDEPSVTESKFSGAGKMSAIDCPVGPIAPAKSITCTATYTVVKADLRKPKITNTAVASANDPSGDPVNADPATAEVTVAPPLPETGSTLPWLAGGAAAAVIAAGAIILLMQRRRQAL